MRAAVYLRISDDQESRELSLTRQREGCLKLADRLGLDVVQVYQDNERGRQARVRRPRPSYRRMLADAEAGRFSTVIAHTANRLVSRPGEHEDLLGLAEQHGTRFAYVAPPAGDVDGRAERWVVARSRGYDWTASQPLLLPVVGALDTFRGLVKDLAPEVRGMFTDVAPAIEPLSEGIAGLVKNATPGFRDVVRESAPLLAEVGALLPPLGSSLSRFLTGASRGAPGASALVNDVIGALSGQAAFWGTVVRCVSQAYLTARDVVSEAGERIGDLCAAAPARVGSRFAYLFDQATTAIGVGIGLALKPLAGRLRDGRPADDADGTAMGPAGTTLGSAQPLGSALLHGATALLTGFAGGAGSAIAGVTGSIRGAVGAAGSRLWDAGRGVISEVEATPLDALMIMRHALHNVISGAMSALRAAPTHEASGMARPGAPLGLEAETPKLRQILAGMFPAAAPSVTAAAALAAPAAAPPLNLTVNGLNINFYGVGDFTDPALVQRVAAGISDALSRTRQEYA